MRQLKGRRRGSGKCNMIKLIASDLDGTLLQGGKQELCKETFEVIEALKKKGIHFVAASGRQYPNLKKLFAPVSHEISFIGENGGLIMHNGELLAKYYIDRVVGIELAKDIVETPHCEVLISGQFTSYLQPKRREYVDFLRNVVKVNICEVSHIEDIKEEFIKISVYDPRGVENHSSTYFKEKWQDKLYVAYSGYEWLDFTALQVNKGNALKNLCGRLGISSDEVMVFGDNINDKEMIEWARYSYAMTNGRAEIKECAAYITDNVLKTIKEKIL